MGLSNRVEVRVATTGLLLLVAGTASAQVTRVATFENYTEGRSFKPSFTDPLSGITFHDSTSDGNVFAIEYSATQFGGGNYLSAAYSVGPGFGWSAHFGFTADLPMAARSASVDIGFSDGVGSAFLLQGINAQGIVVASQHGPATSSSPFTSK
jgi:hypothetical protein